MCYQQINRQTLIEFDEHLHEKQQSLAATMPTILTSEDNAGPIQSCSGTGTGDSANHWKISVDFRESSVSLCLVG